MKSFTLNYPGEPKGRTQGEAQICKVLDGRFPSIFKDVVNVFITVFLVISSFSMQAQATLQGTIDVETPVGGFAVDGDAMAGVPTSPQFAGYGDWFVYGDTPGGVFSIPVRVDLINGFGQLTSGDWPYENTFFFRDDITNKDPTVFTSRNKINDNPSTYTWGAGSSPDKNEIQNAMVHFTHDASGNLWVLFAADREVTNGSSYIDFEFLQNTLTRTGSTSGSFTSEGPHGGRTIGDILLTIEFTTGGVAANVVTQSWKSDGNGGYMYGNPEPALGVDVLFGTNNTSAIEVPYPLYNQSPSSPGKYMYSINQWAEGAANLTALFNSDPCFNISTLFVRTRTSGNSAQSELKDFPGGPVQLELDLNPDAELTATPACEGEDATFTATPADADNYTFFIDANENGLLDSGEEILKNSTDDFFSASDLTNEDVISVQVTTSAVCKDVASAAAVIFNNPVAELDTEGVCSGADAVFTAGPSGSGELYTFFTDSNSDGVLDAGEPILQAESTDNTYNSSSLIDDAVISVLVETTDGCTDVASASAEIFANPIADLDTDGVCSGADAVFTAGPSGSGELYTFFTDSNSDGVLDAGEPILQAESTDNTYNSSSLIDDAVISVLVETTDGCTDVASASAEIFANPIADLDTEGVCSGADAVFTAGPSGSGELYTFFTDSNSDGVLDAGEPILQAESTDNTYNSSSLIDDAVISVLVETTDGCTDVASASAEIFANPIADLDTDGVCSGADAVFTAGPSGSGELYTFFTDSNSDGVLDAGEPILQAESTDNTYNSSSLIDDAVISVLVETTDGCTDVASASAEIFANPIADLDTDGVCSGADAVFTAGPSGSGELYTFFTDSNSDGVLDAGEPILQAESTDNTYNSSSLIDDAVISVLVETTDGCTDVASASAEIFTNPIADLDTDGVCSGADAVFTAGPSGSGELYTFFTDSNSDGVLDAGEPILQAESTDNTYNSSSLLDDAVISVLVETTDGCTDVASASAEIFANPIADLDTDGVCSGADAVFTAGPSGSGELYTFFTDSNSDGVLDAGEPILQAESTDNTYNSSSLIDDAVISVLVETTDGCTDVASASAEIFANPIADLDTDGVCSGADAVFTAGPSGSGELYTFFTDSNSDGVLDAGEPILQAESTDNTYNSSSLLDDAVISVLVETTDGCTDVASASAEIFANPIADLDTDGVCSGADAVFTAGPSGSGELYTFFTDSNSDGVLDAGEPILQAESTDNTYNSSSLIDDAVISVLVETTDGCTDVASASAEIFANPDLVDANVCVNQTVNMGIGSGTYSSSNTSVATVDANGVVSGISVGTATITFMDQITRCSDTATITVQNCIVDEGCTPGFWKNHTEAWIGANPSDNFFTHFGIDYIGKNVQDITTECDLNHDGQLTLLEAISAEVKTSKNNGWFAALARHAVAAFLNASNPEVGYEFSTWYIIEQTRIVFETDYKSVNQANAAAQALHDSFRKANERVCPLGNEIKATLTDTSIPKVSDPVVEEPLVIEVREEEMISDLPVVNDFKAYPVPFKETLNIQYEFDYVSNVTIQFFDLRGQLLRSYKEQNATKGIITTLNIDFSMRANQLYIVKVTTDRDVFTKKIISDK